MKRNILFVWVLVCNAYVMATCSSHAPSPEEPPEIVEYDTVSIVGDIGFDKGLNFRGTSTADVQWNRHVFPFGSNTGTPIWQMAEWGSKHGLSEADRTEGNEWITYANSAKSIAFKRGSGGVEWTMDVMAATEYDHPRQGREDWPHLLVEQDFPEKPLLKDLEALILQFDGRLTKAERKMAESEFEPGLHTAQFQLFITVQNLNPNSAYYGDFLWFGIPFYDYRYEQIAVYAAEDIGKDDASGKFIYSMGSTDFMEGTFHDGERVVIEKDIYPFISKALATARQRGYLTGSFDQEFTVSGMNLGWEVPGTFDVGFEVKAFDLLQVTKK